MSDIGIINVSVDSIKVNNTIQIVNSYTGKFLPKIKSSRITKGAGIINYVPFIENNSIATMIDFPIEANIFIKNNGDGIIYGNQNELDKYSINQQTGDLIYTTL